MWVLPPEFDGIAINSGHLYESEVLNPACNPGFEERHSHRNDVAYFLQEVSCVLDLCLMVSPFYLLAEIVDCHEVVTLQAHVQGVDQARAETGFVNPYVEVRVLERRLFGLDWLSNVQVHLDQALEVLHGS
jgi:hypothetical protein